MTGPDPRDPAPGYTPPPPFAPGAPLLPAQPPPGAYGPPGYFAYPGYPYGYPPTAYGYPAPPPPRPRLSFGVLAASIAGAGFLLVAVSLLGLPWFSVGGGLTTSDVRGLLSDRGDLANSLSVAYFSWFGWVLVFLSTGCAAAAALPHAGLSLAFRIAGPIVAGFAVLFTLGSIQLTDYQYYDDTVYFEHLGAGFWVALVGFACIGAGAVVGPRRHHDANPGSRAAPPGTYQQ